MASKDYTVGGPVVMPEEAMSSVGLGGTGGIVPIYPIPARGLTPTVFADQFIKFRIPYSMPGELVVGASQIGQMFAEDVFRHARDKPFEIWRMLVRLTGMDSSDPPIIFDPQPTTMEKHVRIRVHDTSKNEDLMGAVHLVDTLITGDEGTWEWEVPYTLVRSEGFSVQVDTTVLPVFCLPCPAAGGGCDAADACTQVSNVRVEITFEGYLLIIQPPSETR